MQEEKSETAGADEKRTIIREVIEEFVRREQAKVEPAYKVELLEERKRREQLEHKLDELVDENRRQRELREEAERNSAIRAELQRLGVAKVDLAFRAVKDDVCRLEDGRLVARGEQGEVGLREHLAQFVSENPEFLPARIAGGSGTSAGHRAPAVSGGTVELDKIRPGMSAEEVERVREEIVRVTSQVLKGH
ncbi:MAG: hypothetical protein AAB225_17375 [Acidobacteriota bacterium]